MRNYRKAVIWCLRRLRDCFDRGESATIGDVQSKVETFLDREFIDYYGMDKKGRDKENLLKTMKVGCDVLDKLGVSYWVSRGTLLGWHRGNDFLPGELDIDIDVHTERYVFDIIRHMPLDLLLITNHQQSGHFTQVAFLDRETDVIFDLFFYHDEENVIVSQLNPGRFVLPKAILGKLTTMRIGLREYPVPDPEWYCNYWYGDDWRVPDRYRVEDWVDAYKRSCRGFQHQIGNTTKRVIYFK